MAKKRKIWHQYNFEDVYGKEWRTNPRVPEEQLSLEDIYDPKILGALSQEEILRQKMRAIRGFAICTKTIVSGDYVESNIYPAPRNRADLPREAKSRKTKAAQRNLNDKNAKKQVVRLINANFTKGDLLITLTYEDGYYPTESRAKKDMEAYIKALRRERKKQGLPPLKYLYVIEYVDEGEETKKVRIHHHIIINQMDRDLAESKWTKGRAESKYADPDNDFGLEGYARYITKTTHKGKRRWAASRNLERPKEYTSITKLTKKKMYDMVRSGDGIGEIFQQMYRDKFRYLDSKIYYSDYVGGFYIYARMQKRKGVKIVQSKENTLAGEDVTSPPEEKIKQDNKTDLPHCNIYIDTDFKGPLDCGTGRYTAVNEIKDAEGKPRTGEVYGAVVGTTQNRLALMAVIAALEKYKMPCEIKVYSGNCYLCGGINHIFQAQAEKDFDGVKNADLIRRYMDLAKIHTITAELDKKTQYHNYEMDRLEEKLKAGEIKIRRDNRDEEHHAAK